jgi:ribosomal protein S18 acetylase RimI-like enzyme
MRGSNNMAADYIIRDIRRNEIYLLEDFLYDAIFIPDGFEKPDKEIIKLPELVIYIKDFGKASDLCLVAELNGILTGAIWTRVFPETEKGYGWVDENTPELSMSVNKNYRNLGIGTKLLTSMLERLKQLNYKQVSLSVDRRNFAFRLYQKFDFEIVHSDEKSATMINRHLQLAAND